MRDDADKIVAGDATVAEALRIAERRLDRLGWKYTAEEVGACARKIINALVEEPTP